MKAIITVIGKDKCGIIARVSTLLYESGINILDISQTIMQDMFTMIMLADITNASANIKELADSLNALGDEMGLKIRVQREELFESMHRI